MNQKEKQKLTPGEKERFKRGVVTKALILSTLTLVLFCGFGILLLIEHPFLAELGIHPHPGKEGNPIPGIALIVFAIIFAGSFWWKARILFQLVEEE